MLAAYRHHPDITKPFTLAAEKHSKVNTEMNYCVSIGNEASRAQDRSAH